MWNFHFTYGLKRCPKWTNIFICEISCEIFGRDAHDPLNRDDGNLFQEAYRHIINKNKNYISVTINTSHTIVHLHARRRHWNCLPKTLGLTFDYSPHGQNASSTLSILFLFYVLGEIQYGLTPFSNSLSDTYH